MPNGRISNIGKFYSSKLTDKLVAKRSNTINKAIKVFLGSLSGTYGLSINISNFTINHLVSSSYLDMFKYMHFHGFYDDEKKPSYLNKFKQVGFLVKWIIRMRPIQVTQVGNSQLGYELAATINELFAFEFACAMVDKNSLKLGKNTKSRIIYGLHYREFNESQFTIMLENF